MAGRRDSRRVLPLLRSLGHPVLVKNAVANHPEAGKVPDERLVATYPGWTAGSEVLDPQPVVLTLTWSDELGRERSLALRSLVAR